MVGKDGLIPVELGKARQFLERVAKLLRYVDGSAYNTACTRQGGYEAATRLMQAGFTPAIPPECGGEA